ncbi:MAG: molybdopterin-dependent oxidoreductase [Oleispira sp.]
MNTLSNDTCKTTCPYCGVGCGVEMPKDLSAVSGIATHPSNFGKLCVKGSSLHETLSIQGRLLNPKIKGEDSDWDTALTQVADKIQQVVKDHGPNAIAFYGSGQLLTEDYYVANKLMKGFIGSANMDTNSRLCMSSAVSAYKRAFGSDTVPICYEDIEATDLLILIGSNPAWAHPILYQRMVAAKKNNPNLKIVVIDPRKTASCDIADLHLPLRSGSDAFLFNALLAYLADNDHCNQDYIDQYTDGFDHAVQQAKSDSINIEENNSKEFNLADIARVCEVPEVDIAQFFSWYSQTEKTLSFYSQGINQSSSGTDKCNAIINCHLATGRLGKPGAGPFSITGQPNAMGGREVGGLANQLAGRMHFEKPADIDRIARYWNTTNIATENGLKAVDMFDAVERGEIKFIWIMSTNPLVSMPEADRLKAALLKCEMVVVSDCLEKTDTTEVADILLPAASWGEKNGTVTNSERRISRQRNFIPAMGKAKPDWWIITQVAQKLGFKEAFDYQHPYQIFNEHAGLSAFENGHDDFPARDFDLSGLTNLTEQTYNDLQPIQWPVNKDYPNGRQRFFDDGKFFTANQRAQFVSLTARLPVAKISAELPLIMNTGRIRDQWHTMTRTGKTDRLLQHIAEPFVDLHPADALKYQLQQDDLAVINNQHGEIIVRVKLTKAQTQGNLFVPMHWTSQFSSKGRMGVLVNSIVCPISGQPENKHTPVAINKYPSQWFGFLMLADQPEALSSICDYWAHVPFNIQTAEDEQAHSSNLDHKQAHYYELSGKQEIASAYQALKRLLPDGEALIFTDARNGTHRIAIVEDNRLIASLFLSPQFDLPNRRWLSQVFNSQQLTDFQRRALLAGREGNAASDPGTIICSCFQVGDKQIKSAVEAGINNIDELGAKLKCGTNCGSCVPELRTLVEQFSQQAKALTIELATELTSETLA